MFVHARHSATSPLSTVGAAFLTLALGASAHADTTVGGPIFGDTTWNLAGSPYLVTSSVLVGTDSILTIDPGVEVRIDPGLGISVGSDGFGGGTLVARGTSSDPILFTSNVSSPAVPAAGDWNAITFTDSAGDAVFDGSGGAYLSGSALEHCIIEFGGGGGTGTGSVTIQTSRPWLSSITVRDSARAGVIASLAGVPPLRIESSLFRRCSGVGTGGGVHLTGGTGHVLALNTFDDCSGSSGAGASVQAGSVDILENTFTSNSCNGSGGGLFVISASGMVADNEFTGNHAGSGGGLLIQSSNNAMVEDNSFTSNTAVNGGGLYVNSGSSLMVSGNTMLTNVATSTGGGAYFSTSSTEVEGNEFIDNDTTNGDGGGAYVNLPSGSFTDNLVTGNMTGTNGGGLRVASSNGTFSGNTIDDNAAGTGRGGGIYVTGSNNAFLGGSLSDNSAGTQGGGADVTGTNVSFSEVVITGNEATNRGGGLAWSGTGGSLAGPSGRGGPCNTISGNIAPEAEAIWYAAAFAADGSGDLDASYVCWGTEDPAVILAIIRDHFDNGSIGVVRTTPFEGGPVLTDTIWNLAGSPYVVMESLLLGNGATLTIMPGVEVRVRPDKAISIGTGSFGASCLEVRGTMAEPIVFTSDLPSGERAPGDWIGILFGDESTDAVYDGDGVYQSGCILEHCEIAFAGGGGTGTGSVSVLQSSPALRRTLVRDSARAGIFAGMNSAPPLRVDTCEFQRCAGVGTGGGLHLTGGSGHVVRESIFTDNTGSSGGGASIQAVSSQVIDCSFADNSVNGSGGGLFIISASGSVAGNSFTDNSAGSGGGFLIQSSNGASVTDNSVTGNTAVNGGGLYVNSGSSLVVTDNVVTGNLATSTGGGAYFSTSSTQVMGNVFDGNQTTNGEGGGLYVNLPSGTFSDNSVTGNTAGSNGGGMRVASSNGSFPENLVNDNAAGTGRGGGAYVTGSGNVFSGTEFTGNFAGTQGGGLDVTGSSTTLSACDVAFNEATIRGGGLAWSGTGGSIAGDAESFCVVADNVAPDAPAIWYAASNGNDLAAQSVCWGLFDGGAITGAIHDFFDDSSLGVVLFFPFIEDPACSGTPCPADLDANGAVTFADLLIVLGSYGSGAGGDIDGDGQTDFTDILLVLGAFGPCP